MVSINQPTAGVAIMLHGELTVVTERTCHVRKSQYQQLCQSSWPAAVTIGQVRGFELLVLPVQAGQAVQWDSNALFVSGRGMVRLVVYCRVCGLLPPTQHAIPARSIPRT